MAGDTLHDRYYTAKREYLMAGKALGLAEKIHKKRTPAAKVRVRFAGLRRTPAGRARAASEVKKIQNLAPSKRDSYRSALWTATLTERGMREVASEYPKSKKRGRKTKASSR